MSARCPICREYLTEALEGGVHMCSVQIDPQAIRANLGSVSEMRRLAAQNPDALVAEIERLRAELNKGNVAYQDLLAENMAICDKAVGCNKLTLEFAADNARLREALNQIREFTGPPKMSETTQTAFVRLREIRLLTDAALPDRDAGEGKP